jgi:hypothetical protein
MFIVKIALAWFIDEHEAHEAAVKWKFFTKAS